MNTKALMRMSNKQLTALWLYQSRCVAFANRRDLYKPNGTYKKFDDMPDRIKPAIREITLAENGKVLDVKLWSRKPSLAALKRYNKAKTPIAPVLTR